MIRFWGVFQNCTDVHHCRYSIQFIIYLNCVKKNLETADGQGTGDPDTRRVSKFIYPIHNNANIFHFEATIKDRSTDQALGLFWFRIISHNFSEIFLKVPIKVVDTIRATIEDKQTARKKFENACENDQAAIIVMVSYRNIPVWDTGPIFNRHWIWNDNKTERSYVG